MSLHRTASGTSPLALARTIASTLLSGALLAACPAADKTAPTTTVGPAGTGPNATAPNGTGANPGPKPGAANAASGETAISKLSADDVVAVVGGASVKRGDIDRAIVNRAVQVGAPPAAALGELRPMFEWAALDYAIQRIVLKQAAESKGVKVDDAQLQAGIASFSKRLPEGKTLDDFLTASKNDRATFETDMRTDMMLDAMFKSVAKATPDVAPADVKKKFNDNKEIYSERKKANIHHMVFKLRPDASPDEELAAREKALAAIKAVRGKGVKAFEKTAKAQSDDPRTKDKGGAMGDVTPMQLLPGVSEVAFALKKGEVSDPVRTEFGFHVVRSEGVKREKPRKFAEVKDRLTASMNAEAKQKAVAAFVEKSKREAKVEIRVQAAPRPSMNQPPPGARQPPPRAPASRPAQGPPSGMPAGMGGVPPGFKLPPGMDHQLPLPSKDNVLPNAPNPHAAGGKKPGDLSLQKGDSDGENKLKLNK